MNIATVGRDHSRDIKRDARRHPADDGLERTGRGTRNGHQARDKGFLSLQSHPSSLAVEEGQARCGQHHGTVVRLSGFNQKIDLHVIEELNAGREGWGLVAERGSEGRIGTNRIKDVKGVLEDTKRGEALGRTKRSTKEGGDVRNLGGVFPDGFRVRNDAAPRDGVVVGVATGTTAATSTTAALTALATLLLARNWHLVEAAVEQRVTERAVFAKEVRQVTQRVHGQLLLTEVVVGVEVHVQVDANTLEPVGRDVQHSGFHVDLDGPDITEHVQQITDLLVPLRRGVDHQIVATRSLFSIERREDLDGALRVPVVHDGVTTPVGWDVLVNQLQNGVDQLTTWDGITVVVGRRRTGCRRRRRRSRRRRRRRRHRHRPADRPGSEQHQDRDADRRRSRARGR